jgi:hypothetical protein
LPVIRVRPSRKRTELNHLSEFRGPSQSPDLYRRLRRYCLDREEATGRRVTHQDVMVAALVALLPADGHQP